MDQVRRERFINLDGKSILVTGGTGSFGHAFVEAVTRSATPARLVVLSRDEMKHEEMQRLFPPADFPYMRFFIGDVRDFERLKMAMVNIDYVVHAAAQKIVPMAEYNPFECIHTNIIGMENVVRAALQSGVQKVIALSTDKAASPINLYGATKLASDKICIAANHLSGENGAIFSVVRYGNVLNSRGSVVPFFRNLIETGERVLPVTDDRMTRFWITLPQAVEFVLSSLEIMRGGELFVPKIPTVKILDLVSALGDSLEHKIVGVRPGEKLHEAMITTDEARYTLDFEDRYIVEPNINLYHRHSFTDDGGVRVPEDFHYSSETNTDVLSVEQLRTLLS